MIERNMLNKACKVTGDTLDHVDGHIQLLNLYFRHPSRPDVLIFDGLNLDIPARKVLTLVGGSGSGKSTIISLIARFYKPLSGCILLDDHDIKSLELKWLRQQIGLVNQEPALFAMSIRENILHGKEDATLEVLSHATEQSHVMSFIDNLPDKYETQVGECGIQLSGGQKQRIAIARVMLKKPRILLLDEATGALDAELEKSIQEGLNRAMVGCTTVIVTHHLSTIRNANVIAVVQHGKIIEIGTHDELMLDPQSTNGSLIQFQESTSAQGSSVIGHSKRGSARQFHSFHSGEDSFNYYHLETTEKPKVKTASLRRLYSLVVPDWIFGLFGTIGAFATATQMSLLTFWMMQALVAYYMDWESTCTKREIRKSVLLFCGASLSILVFYTVQHVNFGITGKRLTLHV